VVGGGGDDGGAVRGLDGEVIAVGVVVDQDGGDRLRGGFAGLGAGGQDLIAGLQLADGDQGTGGGQELGARGERHAAGGGQDSASLVIRLPAFGARFSPMMGAGAPSGA
jgi:hypothetical protein